MLNTTQVERQLYILSLLSISINGYSIQELKCHLNNLGIEADRKTIARDIDSLSVLNFPITEEKRGKETFYKSSKFGLENISFTSSELLSVYFVKEILASYSELEIGRNAKALIERIINQLPQINRTYIDSLNQFLQINSTEILHEKNINPEFLVFIREAISLSRRLLIKYEAFNTGELTGRVIEPYMLEVHEGCYHLIAFCNLRGEVREFRVSRITELTMLNEQFEKEKNFYKNYQKKRFGKLAGDKQIELKLIFTGGAAKYLREYESHMADCITDLEGGGGKVLFEKMTTMNPEIMKWVLGYGAGIEVVEPEELRLSVKSEITKMLEVYEV